jgi:acyl carrier protein
VREQLKRVLADVFVVPAEDLPDDATIDDIPQWDSLRHFELMLALEMEFGLRISTSDMLELLTVEAIEDYIKVQGLSPSG